MLFDLLQQILREFLKISTREKLLSSSTKDNFPLLTSARKVFV